MNVFKRIIQGIAILLLIFIIIIVIFFSYIYYDTKPVLEGSISVENISNSVEIIRDESGIPHIFARNDIDAYFSLGYAMAQDRLWQMEYFRLMSSGRLSEVLGEEYIALDKEMRKLMIYERGKEIAELIITNNKDEQYVKCIMSFLQGVNTYIKHIGNDLPIEFRILSLKPEQFKFHDVYAIFGLIRYAMTYNKAFLQWMICKYGAESIEELVFTKKLSESEKSLIVSTKTQSGEHCELYPFLDIKTTTLLNKIFGAATGTSFAISGTKAQNNMPILFNSFNFGTQLPSILYESHIVTPQQNFHGFFFSLSPFGIIGHNSKISWGITNTMLDDTDYYLETLNPENNSQYLYNGKWENMNIYESYIKTGKQKQYNKISIRRTVNGVVVSNPIYEKTRNKALVFKWSLYDNDSFIERQYLNSEGAILQSEKVKYDSFKTLYIINHAENYKQFEEGISYYNGAGLDFTYADVYGSIGYITAGRIPKRNNHTTTLTYIDNSSSQYSWNGYYSFDNNIKYINPSIGGIIGGYAKQDPNKLEEIYLGDIDEKPYLIASYFTDFRYSRIKELMNRNIKLNVFDIKNIANDMRNIIAVNILPIIIQSINALSELDLTKEELTMVHILKEWDYKADKNKSANLIFDELYRQVIYHTLLDDFGRNSLEQFLLSDVLYSNFSNILMNIDSLWFDDIETSQKEKFEDIVRESLQDAYKSLSSKFGKDINNWKWGDSHKISFTHCLGSLFPFNIAFNTYSYYLSGSLSTVEMFQPSIEKPFHILSSPSVRMIVNMNNIDKSEFIMNTGNSGHFHSNNYQDQIVLWSNNEYRKPPNNKEDAFKVMKNRIKLVPIKKE